MRIAYICVDPGVPVFGSKGCSVHVQETIRAFRKRGADVEVLSVRRGGPPPEDLSDLLVHELPYRSTAGASERAAARLRINDDLVRLLEERAPFDFVYERYSLFSHGAVEAARRIATPVFVEVNAPLLAEQQRFRVLVDQAGARDSTGRAFENATRLVAVSSEIAAYLQEEWSAGDRVLLVPNGVNPDRFADRDTGRSDGFTVGFVGSLKPWHGLDRLTAAFARLRSEDSSCRLLIVGDGPQRGHMEKSLSQQGLEDSVEFTGALTPELVPDQMARMDVGTAPYPPLQSFYFSPMKVYEYMAAGLPVVGSRIGQLATLIRHEVDGLLCAPGDVGELVAALRRIRQDPELGRRLGREGRRKVLRTHTWDRVAGRILDQLTVACCQPG